MYDAAFSLGIGPIPWVLIGEVRAISVFVVLSYKQSRVTHMTSMCLVSLVRAMAILPEHLSVVCLLCLALVIFFWQIFPNSVKANAGSLASLTNWSFSWVIAMTFNFILQWSTSGRGVEESVVLVSEIY